MAKVETAVSTENDEARDEIIGVLTAISIVSKRLAKRLTVLDRISEAEHGDEGKDKA